MTAKRRYGEIPSWILERARDLRGTQTDADAVLWRLVRNRQFGVKFRRQHPVTPYVLDFYCADLRLAVELDGGQHYDERQQRRDSARSAALAERGITVIRFSDREVLQQTVGVAEALWEACQQCLPEQSPGAPENRTLTPDPSPLQGEGRNGGFDQSSSTC